MATLIDADVIIQAERGLFNLDGWLDSQPDEEFRLATVTIVELWHRAERATGIHQAKRRLFLERLFAVFDFVPYTDKTALVHARLWAELEGSGKAIDHYDMIVAATALERGDAVATFNLKHFSLVQGLTVIQPR